MKKKYFITIVTTTTGLISNLVRDESNIEETIKKELGGWTTHSAVTSGKYQHPDSFMQAGTTNDGSKAFSIICLVFNEQVEEIIQKF